MGKKGSGMKILAAVAVCAIVAFAAFVALNPLSISIFKETPSNSEYEISSIPPTKEAIDINAEECYTSGIDEDGQKFKNLIASENYQSQIDKIKKDGQRQIDELKEQLNNKVASEIKSIDAIENASGYKEDGLFIGGSFERLFDSNNKPLESLGAYYLRRLNYDENDQMKSTQKIDDYFLVNIPNITKNLYEKYGIEPSFGHFKRVEDFIHNHMSVKLVKVDDEREVDYYKIVDGDKCEIVIESYDENLPEGTNLEFIKEFLIHSNEHLTFYHDITNGDLWSDYLKSCYYERSDTYYHQIIFDQYCDKLGEPYLNQVKEVKDRIDSLQNDYLKQVKQIVDSSIKKIAGIQADALKNA